MNKILNINYEKFTLDNGLEVVLYPDKSLPLAAVNLWYKVGSANEQKGKTGFAHLFEHMMFQGSQNVAKEMHFKYIQEAGGTLNASTSIDRTNYFEILPSNYLELSLWLEADRMGFLLPAMTEEKLQNQKDVVMNERRERCDNQPYGLAWEKIFSNLFPNDHPYHWPTIGWMEDIEKYELNDISNFFKTYYAPNNASLVIGGDFDLSKVKILVEKYFGNIPGNIKLTNLESPELIFDTVKKITHKDNVQLPRLYLTWPSDKLFGESDAVLDILSDILSGSKNSRLQKSLIYDDHIAQDVSSFQFSARINGLFVIVATAKPGIELHTIREEIFSQIKILIEKGIQKNELQRAKNGIRSSFIYSLQNLGTMVDQINNYSCDLGEPNSFVFDLERYNKVSAEQVLEAAEKYLDNPFVELEILPKQNKI